MTKKRVAVVAFARRQFSDWANAVPMPLVMRRNLGELETQDTIYDWVAEPDDVRGMSYDEVMLLPGWQDSRDWLLLMLESLSLATVRHRRFVA